MEDKMKVSLSKLLLVAFFLNACMADSAPLGQEITFAVKDGTFTHLRIDGTDANGQWQVWEQNYETGRLVAKTDGYSWKGTAVLVFDVVNLGRESCVIDNIHEAPGSTMAAIIYTQGFGCSGEGGNARQYGSEQVLFEYMEARDGLKLVEAAGFAEDATGCLRGIARGFTGSLWGKVMVVVDCADAGLTIGVETGKRVTNTIDAINEILAKYRLQVTDKPVQEPVVPSAPDETTAKPTPTDRPTATAVPISENPTISLNQTSNCREGPSTAYEVVYSFDAGTEFEIIGKYGSGWWLVPIDLDYTRKKSCWIYEEGNTIDGNLGNIPVVQPSPLPPTEAPPPSADLPIYDFYSNSVIGYMSCTEASAYAYWDSELLSDGETIVYYSTIELYGSAFAGYYELDGQSICGW
jgi:hypothetical protein